VGVIGLGVGTIAAYGRPEDEYTFYEINPLVVQICAGRFPLLAGFLERQQPQRFDVLAVDAFSSDSIPVHLITLEAFELYFRHIKPDGLLGVHISNQYLNLEPVVAAAAHRLGKDAVIVSNSDDKANGVFSATWIILGSRDASVGFSEIEKAGRLLAAHNPRNLWTDSHSSLFAVLK